MALFHQFAYKKFGILPFDSPAGKQVDHKEYDSYIKMLFLKKGSQLTVDFSSYKLLQDALIFINVNQWYEINSQYASSGSLIYYNRDFYCVEIHDKEVSCDGILYNNVFEFPVVHLSKDQSGQVQQILNEIMQEAKNDEHCMEEMLRILLKKMIIMSTRIWKKSHTIISVDERQDVEFLRKFSQLVELNFKRLHTVADYANLLSLSPKILHKRITKTGTASPNELIKERIILEAKRLLAHTTLSVKEIGYALGYEDPAYFVRLFTNQAATSPADFRKQYKFQNGEKVQ
jgi:AraC-like DNA-binding protein